MRLPTFSRVVASQVKNEVLYCGCQSLETKTTYPDSQRSSSQLAQDSNPKAIKSDTTDKAKTSEKPN